MPWEKESGRSAADNLFHHCACMQCYTPHHSSGGNELDSKSCEVNHDGRPSVVHLEWLSLFFRQLAYRVIAFQLRICYSAKMKWDFSRKPLNGKLIDASLLKGFPAYYGNWRFTSVHKNQPLMPTFIRSEDPF
jgi:hypothetical protein